MSSIKKDSPKLKAAITATTSVHNAERAISEALAAVGQAQADCAAAAKAIGVHPSTTQRGLAKLAKVTTSLSKAGDRMDGFHDFGEKVAVKMNLDPVALNAQAGPGDGDEDGPGNKD